MGGKSGTSIVGPPGGHCLGLSTLSPVADVILLRINYCAFCNKRYLFWSFVR